MLFLLVGVASPVFAQKMLLVEKRFKVKPRKIYVGETLHFRLKGKENYWYKSTIDDILPDRKLLLLDNQPVHIDSISAIYLPKHKISRILGSALLTFGVTLTFASSVAFLNRKNDEQPYNFPLLFATAGASTLVGYRMVINKKLKMGEKYRLRTIEVKF
jgi:hypothetical protein